jgi:hypothetical protein
MSRKMNYDRPVFKTQGTPPAHLTGEVCRSPSGECSAKRIAPDGNTCVGWEEQLARFHKCYYAGGTPGYEIPSSDEVLCNQCRHHYIKGVADSRPR